ncbi:hypothetical protein [Streptomyces sp. NBC_01264]|uniref:hypothetical protein n=1 Tax=Streptomyces sp. NBC_01264 TaxID=2903804 RepID=UPI00224DAABF|nr:hypothetical protein [Streptomyces sp. NBC_01264]MCX4778057.1 hypothetical protein [Streptomyces sp. NBC_01264]
MGTRRAGGADHDVHDPQCDAAAGPPDRPVPRQTGHRGGGSQHVVGGGFQAGPRTFASASDWENGATGTAHAECPAGQVPSGGGGSGSFDVLLTTSGPTETGWTVRAKNMGFAQNTLFASAMCTAP